MDSAYYALIFNFLTHKIERFAIDTMGRAIDGVTSVAFILVTLWVFIRGYAMVTGQLRAPMMDTVTRLIKIALIVTAAKAMSFGGVDLYNVLYKQLPREVNQIMAGSDASPVQQIDKNLLLISVATSAIDMVQVPSGDIALADAKAHTTMMATFGIGAPAMAAGAMLLLYQLAIALIVGLAPLFLLCLAFDRTKDLFRRWLMYAIGTVFSMATLNWVSSIALDLTTRVAAALWTTDALSRMTGLDAQGFSTMAFQQGGVGLLMTVLIISTPPMAAMLFGGVMGNFNPFPGFGSAGSGRSRRAPGGGETPAPHYQPSAAPSQTTTAPLFPHRLTGMASSAQADVIKPVDPSRNFASLDDIAMARAAYGDPRFWTAQVGPPALGTAAAINTDGSTSPLQFSEQGIGMLKRAEGSMHLAPYDDQTGLNIDHWVPGATIGYGHLITQDQWPQFSSGITEDQGNALFVSDLQPFIDTVNASLTRGASQSQFDALVILCFNIGPGAFRQSSALQMINDPQASTPYTSVDEAWRAWNRSQGRVNRGLENRRNAELDLFNNGNYGE